MKKKRRRRAEEGEYDNWKNTILLLYTTITKYNLKSRTETIILVQYLWDLYPVLL